MTRLQHGAISKALLASAVQTPGKILGQKLVLDLNSDVGITLVSGVVSAWNDQGPLGNHVTQATAGSRPAYVSNVQDGHSAIRCVAAVNTPLTRSLTFTGIAPGSFPRAYVICTMTAANVSTTGGPFELGTPGTSGQGLMFPFPYTGGKLGGSYNVGLASAGYRSGAIIYVDADTVPTLWDMSVAGGVTTLAKNNVAKITGGDIAGYVADPLTTLSVGERYFVNFDGDLFRIIIANPAPSAAEHLALIAYFRALYPSLNISGSGAIPQIVSAPTLPTILGSKLVLDLNSDITIPGTGSGVLTWPDQSGQGNDVTQATAANQPVKVFNQLDGHAALQFTAASQHSLAKASGVAGMAAGCLPSTYTVVDLSVMGVTGGVWETSDNSVSSRALALWFRGGGTVVQASCTTASGAQNAAVSSVTTGAKLYAGRLDNAAASNALTVSVNNTLIATTTATTGGQANAGTQLTVGCWADNTFFLSGKLYRIIITNQPPTAAEHAAIIAYLRSQYPSLGIVTTGLPTIQAAPQASPTLAQINGASLVYDLNSDVGVTTNGASAVSAWADSSGQNKAGGVAQPTASLQPLLVANVMDGHAAIRFDGVDDVLENAVGTISGLPAGAAPYIYCAYIPRNATGSYSANVYSFATSALNDGHVLNLFHAFDTTGGYLEFKAESLVAYQAGENGLAARVVTGRVLSNAVSIDLANAQIGTVVGTPSIPNAMAYLRVGRRWDGAYPTSQDLLRIAVVNPPPSAAQHAANIEYFRRTYPSAGLGDPYQAILGGLIVEKWDCRQNVYAPSGNVLAWKGTEKGYALQPPTAGQAPPLAVDAGYFNGIPVIQCAKSGNLCLVNAALPAPLFAAGTRPFMLVVGRYRTSSGTQVIIDVRGSNYASTAFNLYTSGGSIVVTLDNTSVNAGPYSATTASAFALYETAAGAATLALDGAVKAAGATGFSLTTDQTKMGVGGQYDGTNCADASILMVFALSSVPAPAQLGALAAQIRADFATQDTYQSIGGAALGVGALWHASQNVSQSAGNAVSWTDSQWRALALIATSSGVRPSYGADGSAFGGKSVIQGERVATKSLHMLSISPALVLAGSHPQTYSRFRFRSTTSTTNVSILDLGVNTTSDYQTLQSASTVGPIRGSKNSGTSGPFAASAVKDTAVHSAWTWSDGTNFYLRLDGVVYSVADTTGLTADVTSIGVGQTASGAFWFGDVSHAIHAVLATPLSSAQMDAWDAVAAADFPA